MKIGEVAAETGLGIEAIRFYERKGLLDEPERGPSGYRQYDKAVVARLRFILRSKDLGFTLAEIRELLEIWFGAECQHCEVRIRAEQKIDEIEKKVRKLNGMKKSLRELVAKCQQQDRLHDCPLIHGLQLQV
jgi:MerR family mercuric resistance operon transcriptional regulator